MKYWTIGQLARKAGVNIDTIRYYERRGLMPEPARRESGYRQYDGKDYQRLQFILHAKELGFTLKEISELFALRLDEDTTCHDVKNRVERKISDVQQKIVRLKSIKEALEKLAVKCHGGDAPTSECPILDVIDSSKS